MAEDKEEEVAVTVKVLFLVRATLPMLKLVPRTVSVLHWSVLPGACNLAHGYKVAVFLASVRWPPHAAHLSKQPHTAMDQPLGIRGGKGVDVGLRAGGGFCFHNFQGALMHLANLL